MKTVYVLISNGHKTYYCTKRDLYKDYVSQDAIMELEVSEEEYQRFNFEHDSQ